MENMSPFERLAAAKQSLDASSRAMKGIDMKEKIDSLTDRYSKTLVGGVVASNRTMASSTGFRPSQRKPVKSGDENTDDMLNKIGLAIQRKGNY